MKCLLLFSGVILTIRSFFIIFTILKIELTFFKLMMILVIFVVPQIDGNISGHCPCYIKFGDCMCKR